MSNRSATAMEVFSLSALLLQSLSEINTPLTFSPSHPRLPHSQTTRTYQINAHRIASVFGDSLINPSLLHSMPGPTETPSPVPTTVGYDAENEERSPSPGRAHNTGPLIFAFDGEGGISHAKRLVQRQVAQDGSGRLGEDTEVMLLVKQHPQETHIPVNPNPIPLFLPDGISIDDPLFIASQLAKHYSKPQGHATP